MVAEQRRSVAGELYPTVSGSKGEALAIVTYQSMIFHFVNLIQLISWASWEQKACREDP